MHSPSNIPPTSVFGSDAYLLKSPPRACWSTGVEQPTLKQRTGSRLWALIKKRITKRQPEPKTTRAGHSPDKAISDSRYSKNGNNREVEAYHRRVTYNDDENKNDKENKSRTVDVRQVLGMCLVIVNDVAHGAACCVLRGACQPCALTIANDSPNAGLAHGCARAYMSSAPCHLFACARRARFLQVLGVRVCLRACGGTVVRCYRGLGVWGYTAHVPDSTI